MLFKSPNLKEQLEAASPTLQKICAKFDELSQSNCGIECEITRVTDPVAGESGVHLDGRAADIRDQHEDHVLYTSEQALFMVNNINMLFPRDDGKMTCIHHSFGGGPLHFHLQVKYGVDNGT